MAWNTTFWVSTRCPFCICRNKTAVWFVFNVSKLWCLSIMLRMRREWELGWQHDWSTTVQGPCSPTSGEARHLNILQMVLVLKPARSADGVSPVSRRQRVGSCQLTWLHMGSNCDEPNSTRRRESRCTREHVVRCHLRNVFFLAAGVVDSKWIPQTCHRPTRGLIYTVRNI